MLDTDALPGCRCEGGRQRPTAAISTTEEADVPVINCPHCREQAFTIEGWADMDTCPSCGRPLAAAHPRASLVSTSVRYRSGGTPYCAQVRMRLYSVAARRAASVSPLTLPAPPVPADLVLRRAVESGAGTELTL